MGVKTFKQRAVFLVGTNCNGSYERKPLFIEKAKIQEFSEQEFART